MRSTCDCGAPRARGCYGCTVAEYQAENLDCPRCCTPAADTHATRTSADSDAGGRMTTDASQGGAAWRSIDSAPKDGAAVLLHAGRGVQMVARWKVGWSCWSSIPGDYTQHPTHWMPLPEPPEKEPS